MIHYFAPVLVLIHKSPGVFVSPSAYYAFFRPFEPALLVPFICSFNHSSCDPPLTKAREMLEIAFIPNRR